MVAKLSISGADVSTDATVNTFAALLTAEQQLVYLCDRAVAAQRAYNTTDPAPDPLINRVAVVPGASGMAAQLNARLVDNAATMLLWNACQPLGVGETPITAGAGDAFANAQLDALLDIPTLAGQIVYLAAIIESAESAYNTANPNTPINRMQLTPNYDQKAVAVAGLFPLTGSGNASLVGALPY